jgi:putative ATP-binding cassette transporter
VQAIFFMLFALRYVGTLSIAVMLLLVVCGGLGLALFISIRRDFVTLSQRSDSMRVRFVESLADLLSGFKEVTLSSQRSREVRQEIIESSLVMRETSVRSSNLISDGALVAEGALFAVLAAVVCVLKFYSHVDTSTLTNVVAMIILMWGPFQKIAAGIVPFMRSNLALEEIDKLERALEFATTVPIASTQDPWQGRVSTIEARGIEYSYTVEKGGETFRVGPIDLTIRSGEIIFIVGGNGSGKSTLLKVLTGLYLPQAGELRVNGAVVSTDNVTAYRELVSAVFADFHLFQKLYGLPDVDPAEARELLQRMELEDKTAIVDRTFTNTKLSTGQKKRLAMVVALLEARPICVFDEWAADQAPEFRRTFYEDLLPSLRRRGRAIVVISHDDRYFHLADHVVTMETGRIREIKNRIPVDEVESADRATA